MNQEKKLIQKSKNKCRKLPKRKAKYALTAKEIDGKIYHRQKRRGGISMEERKKSMETLCSFYVSDWHIVTMLLPYINVQINENRKVSTILEKDIEMRVFELLGKLNLKNEEKMKQINWKPTNGYKYEVVSQILDEEKEKAQVIFLCGNKDFIEKSRQNIEKWYDTREKVQIKMIDCYEVTEFNCHIQEILDAHDKILNTSGEREIVDVFEGYQRKEKEAK